MSQTTIYVLDNEGYLDSIRTGDITSILKSIKNRPYTLQPLPDNYKIYKWVFNEWLEEGAIEKT